MTKKFEDLDKKTQEAIFEKFREQGLSESKIKTSEILVANEGRHMSFSFGDVTVTIPAPSQGVIDKLLQDHSSQIITAILTIAAVWVGGKMVKDATQNTGNPNPSSP